MSSRRHHPPRPAAHTPTPEGGCGRPSSHSEDQGPHRVHVLGVWLPITVSGPRDQRVATIADAQRGRVSRDQLRAARISDSSIDRMVGRGHLYRELRAVYCVLHRLELPFGRETAALLACGGRAFLSHRSAAAVWGFMDPDESVDVLRVSPDAGRLRGVTVHRSRTLTRKDIRIHRGLPVTSPARALLDLSERLDPRGLERAFDEAIAQNVVRVSQVSEVLSRADGRHGAPALRALLEPGRKSTRTRSDGEDVLLALLREARLPQPEVNARTNGYEVDYLWREERVVVELDSWRFHQTRGAFERDRRKTAVLTAAGFTVLRITGRQLEQEPLVLIATIAQVLGRAAA